MSMPASSCSLRTSSVASRLAAARSSPASRHAGQSLSGSASQKGLGRLPAIVVSNIEPPSRSMRAPIIEPVVAPEQSFAAHLAEHNVAGHRGRAGEVVDPAVVAGVLHPARGPRPAAALVAL